MTNERPKSIWKRVLTFATVLVLFFVLIDQVIYRSQVDEEKNILILEALEGNKILFDELSVLFSGVQDDFKFFENESLQIVNQKLRSQYYQSTVDSLIDFLKTHPGYLMIRLTKSSGEEIFKILNDNNNFRESKDLHNLSEQKFFQELKDVPFNDFYFSSMEPLVVDGKEIYPVKPTVRISKRIKLNSKEDGLLIFNIDGRKIISLFTKEKIPKSHQMVERILLDSHGKLIASYFNEMQSGTHLLLKNKFLKNFFSKSKKDLQDYFIFNSDLVVFSKIILPTSHNNWHIVARIPKDKWEISLSKKRLSRIFWGLSAFFILVLLFWRLEQKRYRDEVLEVLLNERNEFIQNVTHQLKTPLAILINDLSRPGPLDPTEIKNEVSYLIKVVDDLLLLALVDTNPNLILQPSNLLEIISDSILKVGSKAKEKNITIKLNVEEKLTVDYELLERPAMSDLLKSAFMNLLDNAIDFSPLNDQIEIFISIQAEKLKILIKDNGPGINPELKEKLFSRFARDLKQKRKGSGLGLSITKKIIDLHLGSIRLVDSQDGTIFEILI